ncbi:hypothetical protein [Aliikangiella coralliicola]|uniref:Uncharacterized protein n=1 Tax=Aliikangiella coralliicola TaxID=2592383 RepID=A0A545U4I1_9GAMM|nr:hypothetical protein [Aliikangiella coralliicola]TQV84385.1 hypothetical protein FLL46_22445 [Aliikangiella coralliicola]
MLSPKMMRKNHELLVAANRRIEELENQNRQLKLEAKNSAREAREQKLIVSEIYQNLGIRNSDDGALPVIKKFRELQYRLN